MDDCVFCEIVRGDKHAHVVHENATTMAFLDINAVARGHTLVVPRDHYDTLTDMPPDAAGEVFESVHAVAGAIERSLDPDGLNAFHSSGAAAGQDVFHAHVHVIPRSEDDDIRFAPPRRRIDREEGDRVAERIREQI